MMNIEFTDRWYWNAGWEGVTMLVLVDGRKVVAVVFGRGLREQFGAENYPLSMKEGFLRNRQTIEDFTRELIENGEVDKDGYVLLMPEAFAAYIERNNITRVPVWTARSTAPA